MLVLSRKKNEVIRIRDDISIVVVEIRGDKCRLGITAPDDVLVDRDEVYRAKQREGRKAPSAPSSWSLVRNSDGQVMRSFFTQEDADHAAGLYCEPEYTIKEERDDGARDGKAA